MPNVLVNFLHDIQANLLAVAPLVVGVTTLSYLLMRRSGDARRRAAIRAGAIGLLAVHIVAIATATRLVDILGASDDYAHAQVMLVPLAGITSYLRAGVSATALVEIVGNIALLLPVGLLLPLAIGRTLSVRVVLVVGLTASVAIELLQWRFAVGVASVDDVLLNVIGMLFGYVAYRLLIARRVSPEAART